MEQWNRAQRKGTHGISSARTHARVKTSIGVGGGKVKKLLYNRETSEPGSSVPLLLLLLLVQLLQQQPLRRQDALVGRQRRLQGPGLSGDPGHHLEGGEQRRRRRLASSAPSAAGVLGPDPDAVDDVFRGSQVPRDSDEERGSVPQREHGLDLFFVEILGGRELS